MLYGIIFFVFAAAVLIFIQRADPTPPENATKAPANRDEPDRD